MIANGPGFETRRKGFALIAVMWVVLVAGVMLLGVQKSVRANLAMAHNELESVRAHWLARAGVEQALAVLEDDSTGIDGTPDQWYCDTELFEKVELIGGTFSVIAPPGAGEDPRKGRCGLVDHCGLVNVNVAEDKQLRTLCDLADWQTACILDWRDADNKVRPGGAEHLFYARMDYPYLIRNGALRTVAELKLIRGIDRRVFAGEDANLNGILDANEDDMGASFPDDNGNGQLEPGLAGLVSVYSYELNRDANGEKRVNVNTVDKKTLVERFSFTDALAEGVTGAKASASKQPAGRGKGGSQRFNKLMDLLDVEAKQSDSGGDSDADDEGKVNEITVEWLAEHLDELTLSDDDRLAGRINVNTASREVLRTLPGMKVETAEKILRRQIGGDGPFASVGELLQSKTISEEQFKDFAERLTVRSSVFEIRSSAVTDWGIRCKIVAVVDRGVDPMTILYWHQSE